MSVPMCAEYNVYWSPTMKFEEILEACWKGYHKEGMKTMFGKRYPNCVKNKKKSNENIEPDLEEGKRIARKPGQPAGSKKHSDLYTDENPRGTITGLKFATVEDARASVSKIRNSGRSHAHKIQAAVAMEQRARAAGKASAAAVYRRYINANKRADEGLEQEITERCWTGYAQQGMKKKGDRMVPNCVRVAEDHTPDHTTAMSLAQDLNTMMADVAEIRHAGEASTNLNYLRELQRRIGVTEKQIRNLGFKYDVNHPDLVIPLGRPLDEVDIGPEMSTNQLLYKAAAQAMRDAGREGIVMDYEDAIQQASRIYNIPYRPSELPKLLAQLKDIDQRLQALRAQKAAGKQMRQQQKYGTPATDPASVAKIAPRLDRIKPATKTLEETEAELAEDLKKWFKQKWVRFGPDGKIRGPCARGSKSEGKPKCLPQAKAQALGKKGRASAAAKKRREDPDPERRGAAKNVATRVREDVKTLADYVKDYLAKNQLKIHELANIDVKRISNDYQLPTAQVKSFLIKYSPNIREEQLDEKQDACYHKVKSRYKVWPSAYASGALVQCRKKGAANWGTGGKKK